MTCNASMPVFWPLILRQLHVLKRGKALAKSLRFALEYQTQIATKMVSLQESVAHGHLQVHGTMADITLSSEAPNDGKSPP